MKKRVAIIGYGRSGQDIHGNFFASENNDKYEVVAVVDPNPYKLDVAKERYGLTDNQVFLNYQGFVASGLDVDIVINATMDQVHYETAIEILSSKKNMLIFPMKSFINI